MEEILANTRAPKEILKKKNMYLMRIISVLICLLEYDLLVFSSKHMYERIRQVYIIDKVLFDSCKSRAGDTLHHILQMKMLRFRKMGLSTLHIQNSQTLIYKHGISKSGLFQLDSIASTGIQTTQILRGNQVGKLHELLNDDIKRKVCMCIYVCMCMHVHRHAFMFEIRVCTHMYLKHK